MLAQLKITNINCNKIKLTSLQDCIDNGEDLLDMPNDISHQPLTLLVRLHHVRPIGIVDDASNVPHSYVDR